MITNATEVIDELKANETTVDYIEHVDDSSVYNSPTASAKNDTEKESIYSTIINTASSHISNVNPIIHTRTKNKSFLKLSKTLKALGVKNNKFMLRLYDSGLQFIDPYSPLLPPEIQLRIYLEICINPWYFLREIMRIPVDGAPIEVGGGVSYNIDRNNLACWYLFLNGIDHYQSKPRQRGKTQDALSKINYAYNFGTLSSTILFFNKDGNQAIENLSRLKDQISLLPEWLQMRFVIEDNGKIYTGTDNAKAIKNPVTKNRILTMGKAVSKMTAQKLGRGSTAPLMYFDEFDFMPYNTEVMDAAVFAYSTASEIAKKNKGLYGRILTSTPGDLDTPDGTTATEYVSKMLVWKDKMLDEPIEKIRDTITSKMYNRFVFVEHNWKQLGLSNEWYAMQCGLVSFKEEKILREIELKRIGGSDNSPFKRSDVLYLTKNVKKPILEYDYSNFFCPFYVYEKIRSNIPYILSVDPAEGLMGDNCAVTLVNPYTQVPIAEFRSPFVSQAELFEILCKFLDKHCPKSLIVIENNKGRELINYFFNSKYRPQLYYDDTKKHKVSQELYNKYGEAVERANERRTLGLNTSRANRPQYFNILDEYVLTRKDIMRTEFIVDDIASLIKKPNGRIEASKGKHDDNIMSYLMALYVWHSSSFEVLARYGILRGTKDDSEFYDDDGQLTQEGSVYKLKEMMHQLPDNFRNFLGEYFSMGAKSEYNDVQRNQAEIAEVDNILNEQQRNRESILTKPGTQISAASTVNDFFGINVSNETNIRNPYSEYQEDTYDDGFDIEDYI